MRSAELPALRANVKQHVGMTHAHAWFNFLLNPVVDSWLDRPGLAAISVLQFPLARAEFDG